MSANTEHRSSRAGKDAARLSPSALLPSRQSLQATLADLDWEHDSDVETVRNSPVEDWLKQAVIRRLEERHRQRRVSYIKQLERLERRVQALAA